ncbi:MAG: hypothetical protein Q7J57_13575 [Gemmobacter sp.]|nr:hypothetical protein [Gemmobacter sp.]
MSRHSVPQKKTDDIAFPVRVILHGLMGGTSSALGADRDPHAWMSQKIGPGEMALYSWHTPFCPGGVALYARSLADAAAFLAVFPEYRVADGTETAIYTSPFVTQGRRNRRP